MSLSSVQTAGLVFLGLCCAQVSTRLTQFKHKEPLVLLGTKGETNKGPQHIFLSLGFGSMHSIIH